MVRRYPKTAAISVIVLLTQLSCALPEPEPEPEFEHPPESTYSTSTLPLQHGATHSEAQVVRVTAEFFAIIDQAPWLGRTFVARDFEGDHGPVLVLSHRVWENQLGGKTDIIGNTVQLNGREHTVLGIMPPEFEWPPGADLWVGFD